MEASQELSHNFSTFPNTGCVPARHAPVPLLLRCLALLPRLELTSHSEQHAPSPHRQVRRRRSSLGAAHASHQGPRAHPQGDPTRPQGAPARPQSPPRPPSPVRAARGRPGSPEVYARRPRAADRPAHLRLRELETFWRGGDAAPRRVASPTPRGSGRGGWTPTEGRAIHERPLWPPSRPSYMGPAPRPPHAADGWRPSGGAEAPNRQRQGPPHWDAPRAQAPLLRWTQPPSPSSRSPPDVGWRRERSPPAPPGPSGGMGPGVLFQLPHCSSGGAAPEFQRAARTPRFILP